MTEFAEAMRSAGLEPPALIDADKIYRFPGIGKKNGNTSGWCKLFADGLGGVYGDWASGFSEHWQAEREKTFSPAEHAAFKRQIAESRAQAEAERKASQAEASTKAAAIWEAATPATSDHPYLVKKKMAAYDLRVNDGRLVVPLSDAGGNLRTIQYIAAGGEKRYIKDGAVKGHHWVIGNLTAETMHIYLAEGAATAAALHSAIGGCAVAAMSAGNLKPVAEDLHARYAGARIIVCGDDDHATSGNPGVKAATEAANAVGGIIAVPQFPEPRDPKVTDWCDLLLLSGRKSVKFQIDDLLAAIDLFEAPTPQTTPSTSGEDQRIIAEMASLSPLDYDRRRTATAKQLGVRATTLDKMVTEKREQTLADSAIPNSVVEELQPWQTPVDGRDLANEIARMIGRHVVLPSGACTAVTLFAMGSYCMAAWRIWPKLLITSPEKRCGKSTLMEALEGVCYRPLLTSSISTAALFRSIELWTPTLLIDEADTFLKADDSLNGVVNAGHTKRTAFVTRCETENDTITPKKFSVWCPQVIAGIKSQRDTLHDRSIHVQLRRKLPGESVKKMPFDYFDRNEAIRRQCLKWSTDNLARLKAANPTVPHHGNDRAQDNWMPLFAVAELVGGQWPDRVLKAYQVINAGIDDDDTIGPMILSDVRSIFDERGVSHIWSDDLVGDLVSMEERPWIEWRHGKPLTKNSLARLLKPFGVTSGTVRFGPATKRGYKRENFKDIWQRYLPAPNTPISTDTTTQPSDSAGFSPISKRHSNEACHSEKTLKASEGAGCVTVSVEKGGTGDNGYPPGLFEAATDACSGLKLTAGYFISQLDPDDHQDIISNPAVARATAQSMAARK